MMDEEQKFLGTVFIILFVIMVIIGYVVQRAAVVSGGG